MSFINFSPRSYVGSSSSFGGQYTKGISRTRAPSVHGGAGGRDVRISYASVSSSGFDLSDAYAGNNGVGVNISEKATMQNLNDRLATYLEKVRSLESANVKLENQIREWYEKQSTVLVARDYSKYEAIIADLRRKINFATLDSARNLLQIDNAKLAGEDFKLKYENEMAMRMSVEADIAGLRRVLDELTMIRSDLEMQIEGLKEELVYLRKNHKEELAAIRAHMGSSSVNVEVDAAPQQDLSATIDEIRAQYEAITNKNRQAMDSWYNSKFDELNKQVASSTETLQTSHSEINELKRSLQALQIELQSQLSLKAALDGTLGETEGGYNFQLCQMQDKVNSLEYELGQVKTDIERQANEYKMLLDIKTRLELEIAEYRRLLDGEDGRTYVVKQEVTVIKKEEEVKKPVVTRRVKTVVEQIVDGKVVSSVEETDVITIP